MLRLFDLLAYIIGATLATLLLGEGYLNYHEQYRLFVSGVVVVQILLFSSLGVYRDWFGDTLWNRCINLCAAWSTLLLISATSFFLFKVGDDFSRLWILYSFATGFTLSITSRIVIHVIRFHQYRLGINLKNVVIIGGQRSLGHQLVSRMLERPWAGYVPTALFSNSKVFETEDLNIEHIEDLHQLHSFIEQRRRTGARKRDVVQEVWIALPESDREQIEIINSQLQDSATKIKYVPDAGIDTFKSMLINRALEIPILSSTISPRDKRSFVLKRILELLISSLLILILSPFLILIGLVIKLDSKGPVIFKQTRYGLDGREFDLYKFRSMRWEKASDGEVVQAQYNDYRFTRIGKWIRKYSIDELPQLVNVLRGDMALVGPRPHATSHNEYYRKKIRGYMGRHIVRPGITGWAQVNGLRGETPLLKDMSERLKYDIFYIRNWSLVLDFKILIKTISVVLSAKGAH